MHFTLRLLFLSLIVSMMLPSCVSKKKFDELMNEKAALAESLSESQKRVQLLEEKVAQLESDMEAQKTKFEGEISSLKSDVASAKSDAEAARKAAAEKDAQIASLKSEVKTALGVGDVEVAEVDGELYAVLANPVNYRSGSARVGKDGKAALEKLAEQLKNNPSMHVLIEGHTDDDMMKEGAGYKDNWDLSLARAMGVVRKLVKMGVDPAQLGASGKGEYTPSGDNETAEGKAENRRTVVKPSAKTGKLYKLGN